MKNIFLLSITCLAFFCKAQINPACTNIGFESQIAGMSYTSIPGWQFGGANYTTSSTGMCTSYSIVSGGVSANIIATSGTLTSPFAGPNVLFLNVPSDLQRATQIFSVTNTNAFFQYAYYIPNIFATTHSCCQNNYIRIQLKDCLGNAITCSSNLITAYNSTTCITSGTLGMLTTTIGSFYTPNWIIKNFDLSSYIGSCISIEVEAGACYPSGHGSTIYFDANCSPSSVSGNGNMIGSNYVVCNSTTASVTALASNSYSWSGPSGFTSNNQTFTTSIAGTYSLNTNSSGCAGPTQTLNLIFANSPTVTTSISTPTICGGSSTSLTASGTGITSYLWSNGSTSATTIVSPTVTTAYTITANSSTCPSSSTIAVIVYNCSGVAEFERGDNSFVVYPNPNTGNFVIKSNKNESITITDISGKKIKQIDVIANKEYYIQNNELELGVYFIIGKNIKRRVVILNP